MWEFQGWLNPLVRLFSTEWYCNQERTESKTWEMSCSSYQLLHNKSPQTSYLKTTDLFWLANLNLDR